MAATEIPAPVPDERADRHDLEAFANENPELEQLEGLLTQFNIFDAFGMRRQELRHSDFLAFLLDPRQSHGLGDAFVTSLLQRVLRTSDRSSTVSSADLAGWSLDRLLVRREWRYIDLLLVDEEHRFVVIIENKTGSAEIRGQLDWYVETVKEHYPDSEWKRLALYLTPDGLPPTDDTNREYVSVSYRLVCEVVEDLTDHRQSTLDPAVSMLLLHYGRMLRRYIVADSEIAKLCRSIYQNHRRALDLIYEHRPDDLDAMREFLEELVSSRGFVLVPWTKSQILYIVPEWEVPQVTGGEWSTPSGRTLLFEFRISAKQLILALVIGPGPQEIRDALLDQAQAAGPPLGIKGKPGKLWTTVYSRKVLQDSDFDVLTVGEREDRVREQWDMFLENDLPNIRSGLNVADLVVQLGPRGGP